MKTFSVRFPDTLYKRIKNLAKHKRFRSSNQVIIECLERCLSSLEVEYPQIPEVVKKKRERVE